MFSNIYSKKEETFFNKLYIDNKESQYIKGNEVFALFMKTKLPKNILKVIYDISSKRKQPNLNKDEFYMACRYVALAQKGIKLDEDHFYNCTVDLPYFEGIELPQEINDNKTNQFYSKKKVDDLLTFLDSNLAIENNQDNENKHENNNTKNCNNSRTDDIKNNTCSFNKNNISNLSYNENINSFSKNIKYNNNLSLNNKIDNEDDLEFVEVDEHNEDKVKKIENSSQNIMHNNSTNLNKVGEMLKDLKNSINNSISNNNNNNNLTSNLYINNSNINKTSNNAEQIKQEEEDFEFQEVEETTNKNNNKEPNLNIDNLSNSNNINFNIQSSSSRSNNFSNINDFLNNLKNEYLNYEHSNTDNTNCNNNNSLNKDIEKDKKLEYAEDINNNSKEINQNNILSNDNNINVKDANDNNDIDIITCKTYSNNIIDNDLISKDKSFEFDEVQEDVNSFNGNTSVDKNNSHINQINFKDLVSINLESETNIKEDNLNTKTNSKINNNCEIQTEFLNNNIMVQETDNNNNNVDNDNNSNSNSSENKEKKEITIDNLLNDFIFATKKKEIVDNTTTDLKNEDNNDEFIEVMDDNINSNNYNNNNNIETKLNNNSKLINIIKHYKTINIDKITENNNKLLSCVINDITAYINYIEDNLHPLVNSENFKYDDIKNDLINNETRNIENYVNHIKCLLILGINLSSIETDLDHYCKTEDIENIEKNNKSTCMKVLDNIKLCKEFKDVLNKQSSNLNKFISNINSVFNIEINLFDSLQCLNEIKDNCDVFNKEVNNTCCLCFCYNVDKNAYLFGFNFHFDCINYWINKYKIVSPYM